MILKFLRDFAIVMTGYVIVDYRRQPLVIKGVRCAQVMKAIKKTVASGKISPELSQFYQN